jgi:hypothetical protein
VCAIPLVQPQGGGRPPGRSARDSREDASLPAESLPAPVPRLPRPHARLPGRARGWAGSAGPTSGGARAPNIALERTGHSGHRGSAWGSTCGPPLTAGVRHFFQEVLMTAAQAKSLVLALLLITSASTTLADQECEEKFESSTGPASNTQRLS